MFSSLQHWLRHRSSTGHGVSLKKSFFPFVRFFIRSPKKISKSFENKYIIALRLKEELDYAYKNKRKQKRKKTEL